jgi:hypothetical protein
MGRKTGAHSPSYVYIPVVSIPIPSIKLLINTGKTTPKSKEWPFFSLLIHMDR